VVDPEDLRLVEDLVDRMVQVAGPRPGRCRTAFSMMTRGSFHPGRSWPIISITDLKADRRG